MITHVEGLAKPLGKARIRLYTNQRFSENIRLYERLGYVVDREEDAGVDIVVHMSKALASAHS